MGDVAKVNFVKIQTHLNIVPSSMAFRYLTNGSTESISQYTDEFEVVISSYFNDQQLMRIEPVFEPLEEEDNIARIMRIMRAWQPT